VTIQSPFASAMVERMRDMNRDNDSVGEGKAVKVSTCTIEGIHT
jgi:hypothetical protein